MNEIDTYIERVRKHLEQDIKPIQERSERRTRADATVIALFETVSTLLPNEVRDQVRGILEVHNELWK